MADVDRLLAARSLITVVQVAWRHDTKEAKRREQWRRCCSPSRDHLPLFQALSRACVSSAGRCQCRLIGISHAAVNRRPTRIDWPDSDRKLR